MNLRPVPVTSDSNEIRKWCESLYHWLEFLHLTQFLIGSASWNAAEIADGDEEAKEVTVTGAALGDFAVASLSIDIADLVLDAQVTASNTVTCVLANNTGGAINLAAATVYAFVIKKVIR